MTLAQSPARSPGRSPARSPAGGGLVNPLLFSAPLQAGFDLAVGTGSGTFTNATANTVMGFAADATAGASPILLPVASGDGCFVGSRQVSAGVWSTSLADGAPIVPANVSNASLYVDASGPFGYRALSQHINILLANRTWTDAAWSATTMTVTDDNAAGVDGLMRAATLTATAGNATIFQDLGIIASAIKAGGIWVERVSGNGDIDLTLDGGSTWTTVPTTGLWVKQQISQTLADPDFGIRIVTSGDSINVDYGQVEANAYLRGTTPETTGSAVTVNADVLTYPNAGNILDAQGTAFAEVSVLWGAAGTVPCALGSGVNQLLGSPSGATPVSGRISDAVNNSFSPNGTSYLNAVQAIAGTWGTALTGYINGDPDLSPSAYDGSIITGAVIGIGHRGDGNWPWNGTIRKSQIRDDQATAAQIGAMPL